MTTRFTRMSALLFSALCLAVLHGCGASESSVAGTYELDKEAVRTAAKAEMEKQAEADDDDDMAAFATTMMLGMLETMEMTMTLHEDGTASMVMSAMGDTDTMTGSWTLDGNNITITAASEGEPEEPASGTVDGDTITLIPEDDDDMPFELVFKKKA